MITSDNLSSETFRILISSQLERLHNELLNNESLTYSDISKFDNEFSEIFVLFKEVNDYVIDNDLTKIKQQIDLFDEILFNFSNLKDDMLLIRETTNIIVPQILDIYTSIENSLLIIQSYRSELFSYVIPTSAINVRRVLSRQLLNL